MSRRRSNPGSRRVRALIGLLVCAGLLIQQLRGPIHLSLHEHTLVHQRGEHLHAVEQPAGGHGHAHHEHPESHPEHPRHEHEPHPAEDHEQADPSVLTSSHQTLLALALPGGGAVAFELPACGRTLVQQRRRERPPPRWSSPPRGPPAVS